LSGGATIVVVGRLRVNIGILAVNKVIITIIIIITVLAVAVAVAVAVAAAVVVVVVVAAAAAAAVVVSNSNWNILTPSIHQRANTTGVPSKLNFLLCHTFFFVTKFFHSVTFTSDVNTVSNLIPILDKTIPCLHADMRDTTSLSNWIKKSPIL
jgi:hypothetical protein